MNKLSLLTLSCTLYLGTVSPAQATSTVEWHGFVAQGVAQAARSNAINNSGDVSAALTEVGINARMSLSERLSWSGQLVYLNGGNRYPEGARLDYLFLDLSLIDRFSQQLNVYFGRYKNQHWLYSSTRDVPFTRPSIILPQSIYYDAFRDIAVASDGVAIKGFWQQPQGELEYNWSYGATAISRDQTRLLLSPIVQGHAKQKYVHQASVFWQSHGSQATYGMSLLDSAFNYTAGVQDPFADGAVTVQRVMFNWRYQQENWELAAELMQERLSISDFYFQGFNQTQRGLGGYLLGRYRFTPQLAGVLSADYLIRDRKDSRGNSLVAQGIPGYFGYQHTLMAGLSYDLASRWRFQVEHHWVDGTGRLSPSLVPQLEINQQRYWQAWALQLMYWF